MHSKTEQNESAQKKKNTENLTTQAFHCSPLLTRLDLELNK